MREHIIFGLVPIFFLAILVTAVVANDESALEAFHGYVDEFTSASQESTTPIVAGASNPTGNFIREAPLPVVAPSHGPFATDTFTSDSTNVNDTLPVNFQPLYGQGNRQGGFGGGHQNRGNNDNAFRGGRNHDIAPGPCGGFGGGNQYRNRYGSGSNGNGNHGYRQRGGFGGQGNGNCNRGPGFQGRRGPGFQGGSRGPGSQGGGHGNHGPRNRGCGR